MASIMRIVVVTFSKISSRLWNRLWNLGREFIHNNFPDELEGQLNLVIWDQMEYWDQSYRGNYSTSHFRDFYDFPLQFYRQ